MMNDAIATRGGARDAFKIIISPPNFLGTAAAIPNAPDSASDAWIISPSLDALLLQGRWLYLSRLSVAVTVAHGSTRRHCPCKRSASPETGKLELGWDATSKKNR